MLSYILVYRCYYQWQNVWYCSKTSYVFERVAFYAQCSSTLRFAICLQPHLFFVFNVCILCYVYTKHQVFIVYTFYFADVFYVIFSPLEVHNFFVYILNWMHAVFLHCMQRQRDYIYLFTINNEPKILLARGIKINLRLKSCLQSSMTKYLVAPYLQ